MVEEVGRRKGGAELAEFTLDGFDGDEAFGEGFAVVCDCEGEPGVIFSACSGFEGEALTFEYDCECLRRE